MGEDRFTEILSTQKIKDNCTGFEYDGLIDEVLLKRINHLNNSKDIYKKKRDELREINRLLWDVVDGFRAIGKLKELGWWDDEYP